MSEKSPEVRHAEHGLMYREFEKMRDWREEFTNSITDALSRHSDTMHQANLENLRQLQQIKDGIGEKMSMDSALMGRQARIETDFKDIKERHENLMKATERLAQTAEQHGKEIDAAHKGIRAIVEIVDVLKNKSGQLALKVIFGILGAGGLVIMTWIVTRALDAMQKGANS